MTFFHSLPGAYITQAVLHSFLALVIVELSFYSWDIRDHFSRFRYRLLTLTLPIFMYPAYQLIWPERGGWYFRLNTALFDSWQWLDIRVWTLYPASLIFLLVLSGFSVLFIAQEILPIFRRRSSQEEFDVREEQTAGLDELMGRICRPLGIEKPTVQVIDEDLPVLFTQGFKKHTVFISTGLAESLDEEQLRGALTHEMVHIKRDSSVKTQIIYLLRMLMFYNPVSMGEFRKIVHDDEFICDAVTCALTKNPDALVQALFLFYCRRHDRDDSWTGVKDRVESHSHNLLLDERIKRLRDWTGEEKGFRWPQFLLTTSAILALGYLVV